MPFRQTRLTVLRRMCLAALVASFPVLAAAETVEIGWKDLIPSEGNTLEQAYDDLGVVQHDQISQAPSDPLAAELTDAYNGKRVRIPGYVVPLEYLSTGVTTFLLVPYVGACIHVPPPPANQLILVSSDTPQSFNGLFEPVFVTGVLNATPAATDLADVGYALSAEIVEPYLE